MTNYLEVEWEARERPECEMSCLFRRFEVQTRTGTYVWLKKDGTPKKKQKPHHGHLFDCQSKDVAEHICLLHNMNLRGDTGPLHELIEEHLGSAKETILRIAGVLEIEKDATIKEDVPSIALRLIHNCQFTCRVRNVLVRGGIETLGALSITSPRHLLSLPHFGPGCLTEVRCTLSDYDIDWDKSVATGTCQLL